jgi:hypothetical protein
MEITIKKQHTQTINIPIPCFWTNGLRTIGLIDEKTVVSFVNYDDKTEVICASFEAMKIWIESTQTDASWELMTEDDFFEAYDNAMKLITINPILKTW